MKSVSVIILLAAVSCSVASAYITPEQTDFTNALVPLQRQQIDLYGSTRRVIEQILATLRKAASDANDAINRFTTSIQELATSIRNRIVEDIEKLRVRVSNAIESIRNRLIDSGVSVIDCIATHSGDANVLFNETVTKTMTCVDERIAEVRSQITDLKTLANNAVDFGNRALEDMKKCTEDGGGFVATGSCLGSLTVQAEMKALVFATQSGVMIARINLSVATLPAALEVCAGSRMVEAGMTTARHIMEIGTCSASAVFATMTGNADSNTDKF